jgi:hypothetical protein
VVVVDMEAAQVESFAVLRSYWKTLPVSF